MSFFCLFCSFHFQLCDEVDLMHPCQDNICRRFSENFTAVLQNVLQMTKDLPLKKVYMEARENALAEDITGANLTSYK